MVNIANIMVRQCLIVVYYITRVCGVSFCQGQNDDTGMDTQHTQDMHSHSHSYSHSLSRRRL